IVQEDKKMRGKVPIGEANLDVGRLNMNPQEFILDIVEKSGSGGKLRIKAKLAQGPVVESPLPSAQKGSKVKVDKPKRKTFKPKGNLPPVVALIREKDANGLQEYLETEASEEDVNCHVGNSSNTP